MRLSELVSAMSPTQLTEVALLIFVGVFVAVGVRAWRTVPSERERAARLPLDDGEPTGGRR